MIRGMRVAILITITMVKLLLECRLKLWALCRQ